MRYTAILIAMALASAACSAVDAGRPVEITLDRPFTLAVGGTALLASPAVRVGFDRVLSDSRCPQGEQCIVAGEAVVQVWWQVGNQPRQWQALRTMPTTDAPRIQGLTLTLAALSPPQVAGRGIDPATYRATLQLGAAAAGPTDR
jgi:hypothetical protein